MSNSGKQSPLGVNVLGSMLNDQGLNINPAVVGYIGSSTDNNNYVVGNIISDTCLSLLTDAIHQAFIDGQPSGNANIANTTYANLITVGANVIPALGNSKPPTYEIEDPSDQWLGEVNTGYAVTGNSYQGQAATWLPYDLTNPNFSVTQWGYLRLLALQGYNDFNWNGIVDPVDPEYGNIQYKEFTSSFLSAQGFLTSSNSPIVALQNSKNFLDGTYSNMNDLMSADITGVSLATQQFGSDLMNLGKALNLAQIATFGLPSNLLKTLQQNNAITQAVSLALLGAELTQTEIATTLNPNASGISVAQEQKIFGAFLIIQNTDLATVLEILECTTRDITSLADLLNVKKCFPNSYTTLTVPLYNAQTGPTNSKTYYLIYADKAVNAALTSSIVEAQVGTIIPVSTPSVAPPTESPAIVKEAVASLADTQSLGSIAEAYDNAGSIITGAGSARNSLENLFRRYQEK